MYAAGISVARIAELEGAKESSVKGHIQRRRAADPGVAAQHAAAARQEPSDRWRERLQELRAFVAKEGRWPVRKAEDPVESRACEWLSRMRHEFLAQRLTWAQAKELGEALGDWVTTDRDRAQVEHWRERLAEVAAFVEEHGRLPRHRPAKLPGEHTLSLWLQQQNQDVLHGRMGEWRLEQINPGLPGWRRPKGRVTKNG
ncbi:hypothetical protein B5P43_15660 [Bacillus sp. SRB_336]|nr:hypothetical protein B5P43_15660 [Bacillus sp. SRB_336]